MSKYLSSLGKRKHYKKVQQYIQGFDASGFFEIKREGTFEICFHGKRAGWIQPENAMPDEMKEFMKFMNDFALSKGTL